MVNYSQTMVKHCYECCTVKYSTRGGVKWHEEWSRVANTAWGFDSCCIHHLTQWLLLFNMSIQYFCWFVGCVWEDWLPLVLKFERMDLPRYRKQMVEQLVKVHHCSPTSGKWMAQKLCSLNCEAKFDFLYVWLYNHRKGYITISFLWSRRMKSMHYKMWLLIPLW